MQRAILVALALACGCSPYGNGSFNCDTDEQCGGAGGTCTGGYCAFPDNECLSGLRYGERSGPYSNQCVGDQPMIDAAIDAPYIPPDGVTCYGSGMVMACFNTLPSGTQTLTASAQINTDTSPQCAMLTNSSAWCVIAAQSITINGGVALSATGMRPLVLLATGSINVQGTIDVASHRGSSVGPAVDAAGCNNGTAPTGNAGGAGGSFGGQGGNGGAGTASGAGTGGISGATLTPMTLRGGCSGQNGADNTGFPGGRGRGGGAVYLIAEASIMVPGTINASGSGGGGGQSFAEAGGGGAGSGGFIGFDSPSIMVTGQVFANSGGGGEASGTQSTGDPGDDPTSATTPAAGGSGGSTYGPDGGAGSYTSTTAGEAGSGVCATPCATPVSGGGGGGGAGIIKAYRSTIGGGGVVSPPAS